MDSLKVIHRARITAAGNPIFAINGARPIEENALSEWKPAIIPSDLLNAEREREKKSGGAQNQQTEVDHGGRLDQS